MGRIRRAPAVDEAFFSCMLGLSHRVGGGIRGQRWRIERSALCRPHKGGATAGRPDVRPPGTKDGSWFATGNTWKRAFGFCRSLS
jgi:hypothetical protein